MKNDVFCIMPWVHAHIQTNGNMNACCSSNLTYGNIHSQSIAEIWNGKRIAAFRMKMINNQKEKRCEQCYQRELIGLESLRQSTNRSYLSTHKSLVATTDEFGNIGDIQPVFFDVRFSNLCNLKCRMCWHGSSSHWYEEAKLLHTNIGDNNVLSLAQKEVTIMSQLIEYLPSTEEIYFAGGEPLLMEEHFTLLKQLLKAGKNEVKLRYNSNLSKLTYKGESLIDYWNQFKSIEMSISFDNLGKKGDYIRSGQNEGKIVHNLLKIRSQCPHINLKLNPTVSIYNLLDIPALHKQWVEMGLIAINELELNLLQRPRYLNVKILPAIYKGAISNTYLEHINWMGSANYASTPVLPQCEQVKTSFKSIINYLLSDSWENIIPDFYSYSDKLDKFREEKFENIFPVLHNYLTTK